MRFKDFYLLKEEEIEPIYLHGEYWFDQNGDSMYADGDAGGMNHEDHVQSVLASQIIDEFNIDVEPMELRYHIADNPGDILLQIYRIYAKKNDINYDESEGFTVNGENIPKENFPRGFFEDSLWDVDVWDVLIYYYTHLSNPILSEIDATDKVMIAIGSSAKDAREYAIKKWNWSRVHGKNIEVNKLNSDQLQRVAKGINDALEQEGDMYDDDSYERAGMAVYNISTYTGKRYSITLDDMERGNVSGLENDEVYMTNTSAKAQLRQQDINSAPSYYQSKGVIGDSLNFKDHFVLQESTTRADMYSWLSPSGEFFPNVNNRIHGATATILLTKMGIAVKNNDAYTPMFERKWQRITHFENEIYSGNPKFKPNKKQTDKLIELAMNHRMSSVIYDNDEDEVTLWKAPHDNITHTARPEQLDKMEKQAISPFYKNTVMGDSLSFKDHFILQEANVLPVSTKDKFVYPDDYKPLKDNDTIRVYHGFNDLSDATRTVKFGLSGKERAQRIYSYEYNNNPNGLFITIDLKAAKYFGNYIIEFHTKVSDLEAPVWPGNSYTVQGQASQYFNGPEDREEKRMSNRSSASKSKYDSIKNSDRPELAELLYAGGEAQALFVGELDANSIRAVWVNPTPETSGRFSTYTRMTPKEFLTKFPYQKPERRFSNNPDFENRVLKPREKFDMGLFLNRLEKKFEYKKYKMSQEDLLDALLSVGKDQLLMYVWPNQLEDAWAAIQKAANK